MITNNIDWISLPREILPDVGYDEAGRPWRDAFTNCEQGPNIDAWNKIWEQIRNVDINVLRPAVWFAVTALIAYDDCGYMLDSDPGELAMLAKLGDHRAILLLPACIALSKEKDLV